MESRRLAGHLMALLTIMIWGTTFISTKVLLTDFRPVEILFFRFAMGFVILLLVCPHRMKGVDGRQEMTFGLAGLCGICLYYLLENIALTYTLASNVGVIISIAPFFTAILSHLFLKSEGKLRANFFIGFVVAMAGIALISFNGSGMEPNPVGDILAVLAAFVWACYSILTRKISGFGYPVILTTRRTFFYGILFMVPALFLFDFEMAPERFADMTYLLNILYLGLGVSALCFVTWNLAVKTLGAVKTSVYIYMVPVITVVTSILVLKEPVTWVSAVGTVLAVVGLFLSEYSGKKKQKNGRWIFAGHIFTAAIKKRRNYPKNRRVENGFTE
ncbi:DMT family transporter [Parablautia muri]|uniref:DMT family transporter n=1 Tax=Parablautia muri TaxID=2320879 RepID=A0A9X5BL17_9FIRM|nr:DMT family transporter [Parablautia muri]NBJ95567.1 DMT family transporter [Parablautia muri]